MHASSISRGVLVDRGSFDVTWREPATVQTVYAGHLSAALLERGTAAAFDLAVGRHWRYGLLDCSLVTGFDPDVRGAAAGLIQTFRADGGRAAAIVVRNGGLRMLATAIAFGTGLPIRAFTDREAAEAHLRELGGLF